MQLSTYTGVIMFAKNALVSISLLVAVSCSSNSGNQSSPASSSTNSQASSVAVIHMDKVRKVLNTNADIALAAYSDAVDTAIALQDALLRFKNDPTQLNLDGAKKAWLVAREPYGQTEVYRFRLSPIDSTDYQSENGPEGDINAWPLGEALIDYVSRGTDLDPNSDFGPDQVDVTGHATGIDFPNENIINSDVVIDQALLGSTATADDEHDVLAGYHAIEFLLWGQDLNLDSSADTRNSRELSTSGDILNSGGHRPLSDFTTDAYAARRHQYLEVASAKLVADLESVRDAWKLGAGYRSAFTTISDANDAKERLTEILIGMGTLSEDELAGERMQIGFSSNSQEDEHSCFSDNTHRDIWLNAEGVGNSYYGTYEGYDSDLDGVDDMLVRAVNGYGIDDYLLDVGLSQLAEQMDAALVKTRSDYEAIDRSARVDGKPVDVLIMDENRNQNNPIYKTILSLTAQSAVIKQVGTALGVDVVFNASDCDTTKPDEPCS